MNVNYDDPIKNLPDSYDKSADSNNYKLLQINKITNGFLQKASKNIFDVLNLNNASGKILDDVWGGKVNLKRGKLNDEQYVIRLRTKMMQNIANGSFPDLIEALAYTLQCEKSAIHLIESNTPNRVIIKDIPLDVVFSAGFSIEQVVRLVQSLLPVNVTVQEYAFTGTFELADNDTTYDENKGFADDKGTIGGYLGLMGG